MRGVFATILRRAAMIFLCAVFALPHTHAEADFVLFSGKEES